MSKTVNHLRRKTIIGLFSMLAMPSLVYANERTPDDKVSGLEFSSNYMASFGIKKFLLLDKKEGHLKLVIDGQVTKSFSALSGKISADNSGKFITPAGIFAILRPIDLSHPKSGMIFDDRPQDSFLAIHRVIDVKGQKRPERLLSAKAEFKRISDGCINLSYSNFDEAADFVLEAMSFNSSGGIIKPAYMIVLPEQSSLQEFPWPTSLPPLPKVTKAFENN